MILFEQHDMADAKFFCHTNDTKFRLCSIVFCVPQRSTVRYCMYFKNVHLLWVFVG